VNTFTFSVNLLALPRGVRRGGGSIDIAVVIGGGHWFAGMGSVARRLVEAGRTPSCCFTGSTGPAAIGSSREWCPA